MGKKNPVDLVIYTTLFVSLASLLPSIYHHAARYLRPQPLPLSPPLPVSSGASNPAARLL